MSRETKSKKSRRFFERILLYLQMEIGICIQERIEEKDANSLMVLKRTATNKAITCRFNGTTV